MSILYYFIFFFGIVFIFIFVDIMINDPKSFRHLMRSLNPKNIIWDIKWHRKLVAKMYRCPKCGAKPKIRTLKYYTCSYIQCPKCKYTCWPAQYTPDIAVSHWNEKVKEKI
jgi:hypothetical protein